MLRNISTSDLLPLIPLIIENLEEAKTEVLRHVAGAFLGLVDLGERLLRNLRIIFIDKCRIN